MNKLITILATIAIAGVAQAASFMWNIPTKSTYAGMNVYSLTETTASAVLNACQSKNAADWAKVFSTAEDGQPFTAGTGARGSAAGENTGVSDGAKLVFVIVDGAIADGSKYYVLNDYTIPTGACFEPPSSGTIESVEISLAGQGTFSSEIPEPTSGLLLLLGVAGMALRRRQA